MAHHVQLFVGHPEVLRGYVDACPQARLYRLTPATELAVMPLDDDLQDDLHRLYGTGEWLETLRLTTADMAFAADVSRRGALGFVETDYFGGAGTQAAAAWAGGAMVIRPLSMSTEQSPGRPPATRPINAVLRTLGVTVDAAHDEFMAFGLMEYRSNADIIERANSVQL